MKRKLHFKIDADTGKLICNGKPVEPTHNSLQHINKLVEPIKEQLVNSYKNIDIQNFTTLEKIWHKNDYLEELKKNNPITQLENQIENIKKQLNLYEIGNTYVDEYISKLLEKANPAKRMAEITKQYQELFGYGKYAKYPTPAFEINEIRIITPSKEIILTDEELSLDNKIIALDLTAQKFIAYVEENIKDEELKEFAIEKALNMQILGYSSNDAIKANHHLIRVKSFLKHLSKAQINTIKEDKNGLYYDILLEVLIRYITAYASLWESIKIYKKVCNIKLSTAVKREDFNYISKLVQVLPSFIPKANQQPIKLDMSIIYLIAQSIKCSYEELARAMHYIFYNQRPHLQNIKKPYKLNPTTLLQIISF